MIYVTKEQAKVIEEALRNQKENNVSKHVIAYEIASKTDKNLGLVTIARIVEGETYEIGRAFKVGDIVFSDETKEFYTVEGVKRYRLTLENRRKSGYLFEGDADSLTLICTVENREDLAHG